MDDPIEPGLHRTMNELAAFLADQFPGLCFALLVFTQDDPRANYISNARREDIVEAMREFIERSEARKLS